MTLPDFPDCGFSGLGQDLTEQKRREAVADDRKGDADLRARFEALAEECVEASVRKRARNESSLASLLTVFAARIRAILGEPS